MDWITTSTILQRLRDYDDSVWQHFADRFRRPIVSFAQRYGFDRSEADDLAQDILIAFAEGYRKGAYDPTKGRLSSWLFGIAYRQIANRRRKRAVEAKKRDARGDTFLVELPADAEASRLWDAEWEKAVLENCLRQVRIEVNVNTYRAFELVVRQGRSADEAADELRVSRNAVYVAKHRVLKRLNELVMKFEEHTC
jgi:RNA polymerase sigma-70 factor (ECF subfamily)